MLDNKRVNKNDKCSKVHKIINIGIDYNHWLSGAHTHTDRFVRFFLRQSKWPRLHLLCHSNHSLKYHFSISFCFCAYLFVILMFIYWSIACSLFLCLQQCKRHQVTSVESGIRFQFSANDTNLSITGRTVINGAVMIHIYANYVKQWQNIFVLFKS